MNNYLFQVDYGKEEGNTFFLKRECLEDAMCDAQNIAMGAHLEYCGCYSDIDAWKMNYEFFD